MVKSEVKSDFGTLLLTYKERSFKHLSDLVTQLADTAALVMAPEGNGAALTDAIIKFRANCVPNSVTSGLLLH